MVAEKQIAKEMDSIAELVELLKQNQKMESAANIVAMAVYVGKIAAKFAKGTLDEIGIAFVGKRKETAMALHTADEKSHIPFHRFFLLRAEREIHTTVTSDVRNTSRHFFPKAHGSCKLCLVNEREVAV